MVLNKTGYLAVEKYSLASSMIKNDRRIIAVASEFSTKNLRSSESIKTTKLRALEIQTLLKFQKKMKHFLS